MYTQQNLTTHETPTTGSPPSPLSASPAFTQRWGNAHSARESMGSTAESWLDEAARDLEERTGRGSEEHGVPLRNQRDNASIVGASGDTQCSPTSTTMVILAELGGAFWDVAAVRCSEVGLPSDAESLESQQPEEILLRWMQARDWTDTFGRSRIDQVHQNSLAMGQTIEDWTHRTGSSVVMAGGDERSQLEQLESLPVVIGTCLTGGHTVTLLEVQADGVVIHDPYGSRTVTTYLRHGEPAQTTAAPPEHRWREVPHLIEAYAANETRTDWGGANFFTWDEVAEWQIGKWVIRSDGSDGSNRAESKTAGPRWAQPPNIRS